MLSYILCFEYCLSSCKRHTVYRKYIVYLDLHDTLCLSTQKIKRKSITEYTIGVFLIQTIICGYLCSKGTINIHSLYRIRTGLHDFEDLDGYLESNNAEDARISTHIQCLWHMVKRNRYLGVTASNTCSDGAGTIFFLSEVMHRVN
jgi:hypothetical protein